MSGRPGSYDWQSRRFTATDLAQIDWDALLATSDERECHSYADALCKAAGEATAAGDEHRGAALRFVADATGMMLKASKAGAPFAAMFDMRDRRSAIPEDFDVDLLKQTESWATGLTDPELRARMCDLIWVRAKSHIAARAAIPAYLESARTLEDPQHWTLGAERQERALRLALRLGRANSSLVDQVVASIEETLARCDGEDPLYLSERLMALLFEVRRGGAGRYAALAAKLAERAESQGDFRRAQTYYEREAAWQSRVPNEIARTAALIKAAEALVKEADAALGRPGGGNIASAAVLGDAMEAFRRIPDQQDRVEALHKEMLARQQRSIVELMRASTEFDLTEMVQTAVRHVSGRSLRDALYAFVTMLRPPTLQSLRDQAEKTARDNPFTALMPSDIINSAGKVVHRVPGMMTDDETERELALRARMFFHARGHRSAFAQGAINHARAQLVAEHNLGLTDLDLLIRYSAFVAPGHHNLVAVGLHAGFELDLVVSTHILLPQFEASLRHLLDARGFATSFFSPEGIQEEKPLNVLLAADEAKQIFGEDGVFELQDLLVDKAGTNLRNEVAHGLVTHEQCYSADALYFWWLMLRFSLLGSFEFRKSPVEHAMASAEKS